MQAAKAVGPGHASGGGSVHLLDIGWLEDRLREQPDLAFGCRGRGDRLESLVSGRWWMDDQAIMVGGAAGAGKNQEQTRHRRRGPGARRQTVSEGHHGVAHIRRPVGSRAR